MIGLPKIEGQKKSIMRAYSVASPSWADELEFYSIKVADGPLTSRLQKIKKGDTVLLSRKPVGTLVLDDDGIDKDVDKILVESVAVENEFVSFFVSDIATIGDTDF